MAVAYGLMLPPIAVLQPLHARHRGSGAVLGTVTGVAAVTAGLAASAVAELRPAGLFVLGMWWWTVGKMWAETGVLPRALGVATAALGVLAIAAALFAGTWDGAQVALGAWLLALAMGLYRGATAVPSR